MQYCLELNLSGIVWESVVDGPGLRTTLFAQGCRHGCVGCFNPDLQPFCRATVMKTATVLEELGRRPHLDGITLSGGDPLEQAEAFFPVVEWAKGRDLSTWAYTGYMWEAIQDDPKISQLLKHLDVLVDGKFESDLANRSLLFRGSSNQRLIDVSRSLAEGSVFLWNPSH